MYRDSLLGMALASALAELSDQLTKQQEAALWRVFDETMDACVMEAPLLSQVTVTVPPPTSFDASGTPPPLHRRADGRSPTPPAVEEEQRGDRGEEAIAFDDRQIAFPVYRCVDGVWTILMKNPTVVVRNEQGCSESVQLDYLKVYLKEVQDSGGRKGRGVKRSAATAAKVPQTRRSRKDSAG